MPTGNHPRHPALSLQVFTEDAMGRAAVLWFLGVPIPVLLLMWALGWLH
jgi:hypothetical protein